MKKNQNDDSNIEAQVLSMYAKGVTTKDINTHLKKTYGDNASVEMISQLTAQILSIDK